MYQTPRRVFHPISKRREVSCEDEAQPSYFNQLRGVLKSHETLFSVFDLTSQTIMILGEIESKSLPSSQWCFPLFSLH